MLVNVPNDKQFQAYLDRQELALYRVLLPALTAGMRLQITQSSHHAEHYMIEQISARLFRAYRRIYADQWTALSHFQDERKAVPSAFARFLKVSETNLRAKSIERATKISSNVSQDIGETIMRLANEGTPVRDIARQIHTDAPELGRDRATTIARTEVHTTANTAVWDSIRDRELNIGTKEWKTVGDSRVRPSHAELEGEEVDFEEEFSNGLMYPGDPNGDADEVINCRCSCLYHTAAPEI